MLVKAINLCMTRIEKQYVPNMELLRQEVTGRTTNFRVFYNQYLKTTERK